MTAAIRRARRLYWAFSALELVAVALLLIQMFTELGSTWTAVAAFASGLIAAEGIRTHYDAAFPEGAE